MGLLILSFLMFLLSGCSRDFNSPYLAGPQENVSPWALDTDRNGVADSVEKYAPGCQSEATTCLALAQQAQAQILGKPVGDTTKPPVIIPIESISAPDIILSMGETKAAQVQVLPAEATSKNYELGSRNGNVAVVRPGGIYATGEGSTTITVHALDGSDKVGQFKVTVVAAVKKITARNLTLLVGSGAIPPEVTFAPPEASPAATAGFFLTGGKPSIAVVTADGRHIEAKGPGTATFLVLLNDNPIAGAFEVTVEPPRVRLESVEAEPLAFSLFNLFEPRIKKPMLTWVPANATDKAYTLSSSNTHIAKIVGDSVEAGAPGMAYVTLVSQDGGRRSTFTVTVSLLDLCSGDACDDTGKNKGKNKDG